MQSPAHLQDRREPSENELRRLLESREAEKEAERRRTSRKLTKILALGFAVVAGAVLCFPGARKSAGLSPKVKSLVADGTPPPAKDPDLKPFMPAPEKDPGAANVRFGVELLQFLNSAQPQPAAK